MLERETETKEREREKKPGFPGRFRFLFALCGIGGLPCEERRGRERNSEGDVLLDMVGELKKLQRREKERGDETGDY